MWRLFKPSQEPGASQHVSPRNLLKTANMKQELFRRSPIFDTDVSKTLGYISETRSRWGLGGVLKVNKERRKKRRGHYFCLVNVFYAVVYLRKVFLAQHSSL